MASPPRTYELVQTIRFESARRLPRVPDGHPCKNVYGLAFYLDIHVAGTLNPETGWVFDFADIDRAVGPLRALVDHHYLNDIEGLENPTSEVLVAWFWDRLLPSLPGLKELSLRENDVSRIIFRGLAPPPCIAPPRAFICSSPTTFAAIEARASRFTGTPGASR